MLLAKSTSPRKIYLKADACPCVYMHIVKLEYVHKIWTWTCKIFWVFWFCRFYLSSSMWGTFLIWQMWSLELTTTTSTCLIMATWLRPLALKLSLLRQARPSQLEQTDWSSHGLLTLPNLVTDPGSETLSSKTGKAFAVRTDWLEFAWIVDIA